MTQLGAGIETGKTKKNKTKTDFSKIIRKKKKCRETG